MAHPKMFDDGDPVLARVRDIALGFPEAAEKVSHGRPAFYTKKIFAYYGGSAKVDGEWIQHPQSVVFLPASDERPALVQDERIWVPAYLGPSGWLAIDLGQAPDLDEVAELLDDSYRQTAGLKQVQLLDQQSGSA